MRKISAPQAPFSNLQAVAWKPKRGNNQKQIPVNSLKDLPGLNWDQRSREGL
jgi:hypothetical protein